MDIVDINKVLDDLELNEEQHSKLTKAPPAPHENLSGKQNDIYASYKYGQTTSGPPSVTPMSTTPPISSRITKTNFVKVSNVFNSLNEYVNAGIDTVKITEQTSNTQNQLTTKNDACAHIPNSSYVAPINPLPQYDHYGQIDNHTSVVEDSSKLNFKHVLPNVSQNDQIPRNSIGDEMQPQNVPDQQLDDIKSEFSSEQNVSTTATFPSYNEYQNVPEPSQKSTIDTSENELIQDSRDVNESIEQTSSSSESDDTDSLTCDEKTSDAEFDNKTADESIDLRTGDDSTEMQRTTELSSVVPPTSLSFEITATHETDTALPETMNGESNRIEIVAKEEEEATSQLENETMPEMKDDEYAVENTENQLKIDEIELVDPNNTPADVASQSQDRFIKPISFETAATMDDVSDTELESYLQELEDMEESSIEKAKNDLIKNPKLDDVEAFTSDSMVNVNHTFAQIASRDDRNADSFSQASTVEFGEVNATSSNEQISNVNSNQNIESAPSVESFLDAESTVELSEQVQHERIDSQIGEHVIAPVDSTIEELIDNAEDGDRDREAELSSDLDNHTECSECELDQLASGGAAAAIVTTAKRPNSLNLQNCNSTLIDSQQNPSNYSADENAGNTPAACGQFLSSSISSDDSNIIADGNQINQLMDSESANESNVSENYANSDQSMPNAANISIHQLGKMAPYWVPDNMTVFCMQCNQKFSFIKRRHHCRACGLVLCSACCSLKAKLEYLGDVEARICVQCDIILNQTRDSNRNGGGREINDGTNGADGASVINSPYGDMPSPMARSPNPNNPMEYCSVIPPYQQVTGDASAPISVMVPVGVLKREGVAPKSQRKEKNVMFSDGIRPGCDLTDLDNSWDSRPSNRNGELSSPSRPEQKTTSKSKINANSKLPTIDPKTNSYIPPSTPTNTAADSKLPPICISTRCEFKYTEVANDEKLMERLQSQQLKFMLQRNFYVLVKIIKLSCCINKSVINFTTQGMHLVGQDEIVILLELDSSNQLPKDIFIHLNEIYRDADKGQAITELGFSMASTTPFLGSKEHGGFLFIRTTFQCMQNVTIPENPYLIGILIHRWEVPWAKIFPLRLMLRLGALHRYYPSPHVSVRGRNSVYAEIAQTIINFLADFRTYSYTISTIRGMYIHMEDRRTNVLIPRNRYDQVMKALNNSNSDHIFALAGNFSEVADGHLVCVQNTESGCAETHAYSTQAINIQGKPRKVTGASFLVLNGALKTTSGLSGKCSIVEDGLMVQILPKKMAAIQQALKTMKDIDIVCGPVDGDESQTELVCIQWVENDTNFNVGVISPIDKKPMNGIPSIRVHHGLDFANSNHIIRWTEVFILKSDDESAHGKDPIDMSKLSEQIARSASMALVSFLDLLATNGMTKLAIRATLDQDQVCYEAGSNHDKLAPLYMNALDNELIPTLHRQATNLQLDQTICLELIFHIMDV